MDNDMRKICPEERKNTFNEVSLGFNEEEALAEAGRCLQCKNAPCIKGCPAGINVREFIELIRRKDYAGAIREIKKNNSLPGVCGRVCPQEEQCQLTCVLNRKGNPVKIGYLERFVSDLDLKERESRMVSPEVNTEPGRDEAKIKVGVIGAGPAGLTCAADLAKAGFEVHLFEALHKAGGVLVYGIPEFRLPKHIVEKEVEDIKSLGVNVVTDFVVGRTKTIEDLRGEGFKAFFIGVGAGLPRFLNVPGENLNRVYSANEFLTRVNLMKSYRFPEYDTPVKVGEKVGVFGAGNVSFDCARCALRLGAKEVYIIYRRTREEMPAREEEIYNAEQEGIIFKLLNSPREILPDDQQGVRGVVCIKNQLGEPDSSGRRRPVPVPGSEFTVDIDTVIIAVGTTVNPLLISTMKELEVNSRGYIKVNDRCQTSIPDVFAGGDIVSGSATVISAISQAKQAVKNIKDFLLEKVTDNQD